MKDFMSPDDFDDLGQPITFSFGGKTYSIPAIVPSKSKKLMKMGRDISRKARMNEKKIKELEEQNLEIPDEVLNEVDDLFDFQMDFIVEAGAQEIGQDGIGIPVEKSFMNDNWPNKLIGRVFKRINENFIDSEQEKKS